MQKIKVLRFSTISSFNKNGFWLLAETLGEEAISINKA
jgi:hypothetical protein